MNPSASHQRSALYAFRCSTVGHGCALMDHRVELPSRQYTKQTTNVIYTYTCMYNTLNRYMTNMFLVEASNVGIIP